MSTPISQCMIRRAAIDEVYRQEFIDIMMRNMAYGAYTKFPCTCVPPCPIPSDEQLDDLQGRLDEACKNNPYNKRKQ